MGEETMGQVGYNAYGQDAGWKTFDGRDMPQWADLTPVIKARWEVAAEAIKMAFLGDEE